MASLNVVNGSNNPAVSASIQFTDSTGGYSYTLTDTTTGTTPTALNGPFG